MARRTQANLTVDRIVSHAFALLEEEGLEALSMRRLADKLQVRAPALYWHVADKAELFGLMARDIYSAAYSKTGSAQDWREWLRQFGRALHDSLSSHRDGARLCAIARPASPVDAPSQANRIAAPLTAQGIDERQALAHQAAVISFTLGWTTFETNGPMRDFLRQIMDFDATFAVGLDALVSGLEA